MKEIDQSFYTIPTLKIKKDFSEVYSHIEEYNLKFNLECNSFKEKLYCYINKIFTPVLCIHCKMNKVAFENSTKGYKKFCSCKCKANSNENKTKLKETLSSKYGVENISQLEFVKQKKEETFKEKYGDANPLNAFKEDIKATWKEKWGVDNPSKANEIKDKISIANKLQANTAKTKRLNTVIERHNVSNVCFLKNKKDESVHELLLAKRLGGNKFKLENYEFDIHIPNTNILIECDGEHFHPMYLNNLTLTQVNNRLNDFRKNEIAKKYNYNLYRVRTELIESNIFTLEDVVKFAYIPDNSISYSAVITSKATFEKYIAIKGMVKLERYLNMYVKFFRTFIPNFLYPEPDDLQLVFDRIPKYNNLLKDNTFFNTKSTLGNNFLKSIFKSFFSSSFKHNNSVEKLYQDDNVLKDIIKYRIGINDHNEIYDLSFQTIIQGFSAIRRTVSFFKPSLAYSIYNHFITTSETPITLDPCCGFGGRMLGFFIRFPRGKYIGCEPNKETYNELIELKRTLSDYLGYEIDCHLYNLTIEEFIKQNLHQQTIDFTFTSIPYYDKEIYSEDIVNTNYSSFDDWRNKFLSCFNVLPNCYVNLPQELFEKSTLKNLELYFLKNNVAKHLDKRLNEKIEYIVNTNK